MISFLRSLPFHLHLSTRLLVTAQKEIKIKRSLSTGKNKLNSKIISKSTNLMHDNWSNETLSISPITEITASYHSIVTTAVPFAIFNDEYLNLNVLPDLADLVRDVSEIVNTHNLNQKSEWFSRALEYNLKNGKNHRFQLTVLTYTNLIESQDLKVDNIKLAHVLGWCAEMLHAALMTCENMIDQRSTRHGQICWHKLGDVGTIAINDALMFENAIYFLLKKYFKNSHCFVELVELFREMTFVAANGLCQEMLSTKDSVKLFTMQKFKNGAAMKTASYSLYLPFALALHLAGVEDQETFRQSKQILLEMGELYQIQKDYWNCFGDSRITENHGTDIQDSKCSWLAVVCMQRANYEQKQIMLDCYGKNDPKKIQTVKNLYKTLELPKIYAMQKEETYSKIKSQFLRTSNGIPYEILLQVLNNIYQRESNFDTI